MALKRCFLLTVFILAQVPALPLAAQTLPTQRLLPEALPAGVLASKRCLTRPRNS